MEEWSFIKKDQPDNIALKKLHHASLLVTLIVIVIVIVI